MNKELLLYKIRSKGYTQNDFAKLIGMSATSLSYKMNGKVDFSLTEIQQIGKVLQLNSDDITIIFFN